MICELANVYVNKQRKKGGRKRNRKKKHMLLAIVCTSSIALFVLTDFHSSLSSFHSSTPFTVCNFPYRQKRLPSVGGLGLPAMRREGGGERREEREADVCDVAVRSCSWHQRRARCGCISQTLQCGRAGTLCTVCELRADGGGGELRVHASP